MARFRWFLALLSAGCVPHHPQSMVHPAGPGAAHIAGLWWIMLGVLGAVTAVVLGLLAWGLARREGDAPPGGATRFIVWGGILLPSVILVGLLVLSLSSSQALRQPSGGLTIEVVGHQWWWEVRYPEAGIVTANELLIPAGVPVRLELRAADVIHSFWVPNLTGKRDLLPDVINTFWLQADAPGEYHGQCAEFCGTQHARMAFRVVAMPPDEFAEWVEARRSPPAPPTDARLQRGRAVFQQAGCASCHAIAGVSDANVGPDLTHLGSRRTLGAGTLPNTAGNLAGWIANPQALKPGNLMPRAYLPPEDLHALVDYLESLR